MGSYGKQRVEMVALQVLQAMLKRNLQRLQWVGMSVTKGKIGDSNLQSLNILHFMSRPERRTTSMFYVADGGSKTISSPLPGRQVRDFSPPPSGAGEMSPLQLQRLQAQSERQERESARARNGKSILRKGSGASTRALPSGHSDASLHHSSSSFKRGAPRSRQKEFAIDSIFDE